MQTVNVLKCLLVVRYRRLVPVYCLPCRCLYTSVTVDTLLCFISLSNQFALASSRLKYAHSTSNFEHNVPNGLSRIS